MLNPEVAAHFEAGSAEIVGFVTPDGRPYATRGWGIDVLDADAGLIRLLMRAVDLVPVGLGPGDRPDVPIAITASDVPTLFSIQIKGRLEAVDASVDGDPERVTRYCDAFIDDVVGADRIRRNLMELWRPTGPLVACTVRIDEQFAQTPGPDAGARLPSRVR